MDKVLDKKLRHLVQTLLAQVVDVNNHVRAQQDNKDLSEGDKIATTNFANYHLTVLSILLHDLEDFALEKFPDAKGIIEWAMQHYNFAREAGSFKPCQCEECKVEREEQEKIKLKDKEILESA